MIKHIVCWRFAPENKQENIEEAKRRLLTLPALVKEIRFFDVGINFNDSEFAYDMVLVSEFDDKEALEHYQNNPEHKEVSAFIRSVITQRAVVDYTM